MESAFQLESGINRRPVLDALARRRGPGQIASMVRPAFDIAHLTVAERLELLDALWDSLRSAPDAVPLSDAERQLIDERRADHRRDPGAAIPWETVRAELLADQDADDRARAESTRDSPKRG